MHYLYILHSKSIDKYYTGESVKPEERLALHNQHHFKSGFTKAASDWEIVLKHKCNTKEDAQFLEKIINRFVKQNKEAVQLNFFRELVDTSSNL
ncbi:GIY-YIG nuclease family protein [Aurantibacter crassamenti]|uniref:GIY-YIG nuclease family protein n=1 Tax=Aurantibacter crassamenti TaxID=1837375 RepID=UPI00193AB953|nr:GIY-YIG nuclease family protein [Aurantibacter crassamenti]MBM1104699.1 GIY-YIG nuclease family protein [Aurantibacter crassamenti]